MSNLDSQLNGQVYEFGRFRLDVAERLLLREGELVRLPPKVFDLLVALVESGGRLDAIQQAFVEYGAVQCGYCTPGVIMSAKAILNLTPEPTEDDINDGLAGVICRCTGHFKVKEAVRNAGRFATAKP